MASYLNRGVILVKSKLLKLFTISLYLCLSDTIGKYCKTVEKIWGTDHTGIGDRLMVNIMDKLWKWVESVLLFIVSKIFRLKLSEKTWLNLLQFVKFGIIGIFNNVICYVTYFILIKSGLHYIPANIIGFSVSVYNAYYWNNKYVFATKEKRIWWITFLKTYLSYAGTGIVLSNVLLVLWIEHLHISRTIAPVLNLLLTVPVNYLVNKFWTYKER